jgi:hypothetical protein
MSQFKLESKLKKKTYNNVSMINSPINKNKNSTKLKLTKNDSFGEDYDNTVKCIIIFIIIIINYLK